MFCSNCGNDCKDASFCSKCGSKVAADEPQVEQLDSARQLCLLLEENWGSEVDIEPSTFETFTVEGWKSLQRYLNLKSRNYIRARTWTDYWNWIVTSDDVKNQSIVDTRYSLIEAITAFAVTRKLPEQSWQKVASLGTLANLPFGHPQSGDRYSQDLVEIATQELEFAKLLVQQKHEGTDSTFSSAVFIESLDLFSDSARCCVSQGLSMDVPNEAKLIISWAPTSGELKIDMTSVYVALWYSEELQLPEKAAISPRMLFALLVDEFYSQPNWMEMGFWADFRPIFFSEVLIPFFAIENGNLEIARAVRNALNPEMVPVTAAQTYSQDMEMIMKLLGALSPNQ